LAYFWILLDSSAMSASGIWDLVYGTIVNESES
jgi:hypothetical protein